MADTDEHTLTVRIPTELHARLAKLATAEERPVSYVVRKALDAWLTLDEPIRLVPSTTELRPEDMKPGRIVEVPQPEMVLRRPKSDPAVLKPKCPHPKDQRTSYGSCKACGGRVS